MSTRTRKKPDANDGAHTVAQPPVDPDLYSDYQSALIRYGILRWAKNNGQKAIAQANGGEGMDLMYGSVEGAILAPIDIKQVQYLNMRLANIPISECCKALEISMATPLFWAESEGENSVYAYCLDAIDQMQANQALDVVVDNAINNRKATLERMFFVKGRKPEFRDNYQPKGVGVVNLNLTFNGGNPLKVVYDTSEERVNDVTADA